jgi:hypothetical protein
VKLVAHTFPATQSAVVVQVFGQLVEAASAHAVPPSARVRHNKQLAAQTSAQVPQAPASLQAWMGSQQTPLQQTCGASQSCLGCPLPLGVASHNPVFTLQV